MEITRIARRPVRQAPEVRLSARRRDLEMFVLHCHVAWPGEAGDWHFGCAPHGDDDSRAGSSTRDYVKANTTSKLNDALSRVLNDATELPGSRRTPSSQATAAFLMVLSVQHDRRRINDAIRQSITRLRWRPRAGTRCPGPTVYWWKPCPIVGSPDAARHQPPRGKLGRYSR